MEDEFLTNKCRLNPAVFILSVVVFAVATAFYSMIFCDLFEEGMSTGVLVAFMYAVICTLPIASCIMRLMRGHMAKKLAQELIKVKDSMIDCADFERIYGVQNAAKNIELLCAKGYLTKVEYAPGSGKIYFLDRIDPANRFRRAYVCPHCGASRELEPYAPSVCEYCGSIVESYVKV